MPDTTIESRKPASGGRLGAIPQWAVTLVALLMLALMIIPAEFWRRPGIDAIYRGFDPSLVYVDDKGEGSGPGVVEIFPTAVRLTALPHSKPRIHLVTTPLRNFSAQMRVRILDDQRDSMPFRVGIWTPRNDHGLFVVFKQRAVAVQTKAWGGVIRTRTLGAYSPGQLYGLELSLNKDAGNLRGRVFGPVDSSPSGGRALRVAGQLFPRWVSHIYSVPIPVGEGQQYTFGGAVKSLGGSGLHGFVLEWWDSNRRRLSKSEEWDTLGELAVWETREFNAKAPSGARFAVFEIAAAPGSDLLFADLFIRNREQPRENLLINADFGEGAKYWRRGSTEQIPLELLDYSPVDYRFEIFAAQLPELFDELRLSLSVNASASDRPARALMESYALTLPHQRWLAVKIDDVRVRMLVIALCAVGALLLLTQASRWVLHGKRARPILFSCSSLPMSTHTMKRSWLLMANVSGAFAYLGFNALLFNRGSLNYDLLAGTTWAYTLARYGLTELFHLSVVTGVPEAWAGVPIQEVPFAYLPVMGYLYLAVGWIYRLFLAQPGAFVRDQYLIAFVIKALTALFTYGCAVLIYLIFREQKAGVRWSLVAAGFFLLNPAVWFVGSIWGQTQSWSIFFLLLAIWLGERRNVVAAWLALMVTALTRQQMLIPATLLAVVFLRRFSLRENQRAVSWGVIMIFLLLSPFSLRIGPTLVEDNLLNALGLHFAGFNDQWTTLVSWSALSIWPLITRIVDGQTGLERVFFSAREPVIAGMAYWELGNFLFGLLFVGVAALLSLRRSLADGAAYFPALSLAMLGLFMLKTEFAAFHLLPALALVILCRKSMGGLGYAVSVIVLTVTIFVPMYSIGAIWLSYNPPLSVGLFDPAQPVTRFFKSFMTRDWFLTLGSLANLFVLVGLAVTAARKPRWSENLLNSTPEAVRGGRRTSA